MEISPESMPWQSLYKLLIGSIVPRPIGWISTVNPAGQPNLAPFSFFNVACANPPCVLFCPMIRSNNSQPKDTLRNIRETGEFVVNLATEALAKAINLTSGDFPADVSEFAAAGLTPLSSILIRSPRVAESPINLECQIRQIIDLGDQPGSGSIVIGEVVYFHIADEVLIPPDKIDIRKLKPIARLAGNSYCRVTDIFDMERPNV